MKTHIHDYQGVLLRVEYTPDKVEGPTIHSVHVLDRRYRVVGPDLVPLLHDTLVLVAPGEAETFLSLIAGDLV
jgi:hypothetical protein